MTSFPTVQSLLFVFLLIQTAVCSSIEFDRLNRKLNVLTSKQETTQLEIKDLQDEVAQLRNEAQQARQEVNVAKMDIKQLQDEVEQIRNEAQEARQEVNVAKLEIKQLQDEVQQLKNEVHKARQQVNVSGGIEMTGSCENKCSCETAVNLTKEHQDIRHHRINDSEQILKLDSFSRICTDELSDRNKIFSTFKELAMGFRQEKQRRKYFEIRTDAGLFAINDTIFRLNQKYQSSSLSKDDDSSIKEMNSTLNGLLFNVEVIKSSIRNIQNDASVLSSASHSQSVILANSSNTIWRNDAEIRQIFSELENLKGVIANISRSQTSILETATTSSTTIASTISLTSHLCARTVTDETLILSSLKVGSRVVRGRDWPGENPDGVPPAAGTVKMARWLPGRVFVVWDSGEYGNYRVGYDKKFDLYICE